MRSTMTEYFGSSVIFVPPHFTISPLIPCRAPFSFTLAMNAGGKLYSRPTRRPIGLGALDGGLIVWFRVYPCSSVARVHPWLVFHPCVSVFIRGPCSSVFIRGSC